MAVETRQREYIQLLAQAMRVADDLAKQVREAAGRDGRLSILVPKATSLAEIIRNWAMEEFHSTISGPHTEWYDSDGYHIEDSVRIDAFKSANQRANDHLLRAHAAMDRYEQERDLGRQWAQKYNPHYKNKH